MNGFPHEEKQCASVPFTYAAMASAVSRSGSMVIRIGVRFGRDFTFSTRNKKKKFEH